MTVNRRNFLRISAAGAAGSMLLNQTNAESMHQPSFRNNKEIIYRTLGKTGLRVPIVSLGVMKTDNPKLVSRALEGGMLHLDTAHGYQDGKNEEMLGILLKDRPRDSYILSTKIHDRGKKLTREEFMEKFELSLKRLQMDYVDILYLHASSSRDHCLSPEYLAILKSIKDSGKARFLGVSSHQNMPEILNAIVESNLYDVALISWNFKMKGWKEMEEAVDRASKAGIGLIAMKTMAGGFWDKERTQPINTRAALKWALQNESIHTSIPGCTTFDQLETNLEIMTDIALSEEELNDLKLNGPSVEEMDEKSSGLFCKGCQECIPQCPHNQPIPQLMRSYMYTYGYSDPGKGREVLEQITFNRNVCRECGSCQVSCPLSLPVAERICDIERLMDVPKEFIC